MSAHRGVIIMIDVINMSLKPSYKAVFSLASILRATCFTSNDIDEVGTLAGHLFHALE